MHLLFTKTLTKNVYQKIMFKITNPTATTQAQKMGR